MQPTGFPNLTERHYRQPPNYRRDEDFGEVEAHIQNLRAAIEEVRDDSWSTWSGARAQIRGRAEALCLKAEVILWRLRVAKHFAYPERDVLWEDIKTSIADFEEIAESIVKHSV